MTDLFVQSKVVNDIAGETQTTWIPEKFAEVDRYLELKDQGGTWTNHWRVVEAYTEAKVPWSYLKENERNWKSHRSATDI